MEKKEDHQFIGEDSSDDTPPPPPARDEAEDQELNSTLLKVGTNHISDVDFDLSRAGGGGGVSSLESSPINW